MWKCSLAHRAPSSNTLYQQGQLLLQTGAVTQLTHQQLTAQQAWHPSFLSALALACLPLLPLFLSPWKNALEGQHAGTAASIGASWGSNFGQTQGREVKEMKQWADCQRYPNAWRWHSVEIQRHLSISVPWATSTALWKSVRTFGFPWSNHPPDPPVTWLTWFLNLTFTLIKGEHLTWKTGVETLSSTFLPAVTHLTLHQPSALSRRARLCHTGFQPPLSTASPVDSSLNYKEANEKHNLSLPRAEGQNQCVCLGVGVCVFQHGRSQIQKANSQFKR